MNGASQPASDDMRLAAALVHEARHCCTGLEMGDPELVSERVASEVPIVKGLLDCASSILEGTADDAEKEKVRGLLSEATKQLYLSD